MMVNKSYLMIVGGILLYAICALYSWPPPLFPVDDQLHLVTATQASWLSLWTQPHFGLFIPLAYSLMKPLALLGGHQLLWASNLALHFGNGLLLYHLARRILPEVTSLLLAIIFIVHPENVQVALWMSEFRGTLSTFLLLAALLLSLHQHLSFSIVVFVLSMLAKPTTMAFAPYFMWQAYRTNRAKGSLFAGLIILNCVVIYWLNRQGQPLTGIQTHYQFWQIPQLFAFSVGHYLFTSFLPINLAFDYGYSTNWILSKGFSIQYLFFAFFIGLCLVKPLRDQLQLYVMALLPVSGLVHFNYQTYSQVCDRYHYCGKIFLLLLLGLLLRNLPARIAYGLLGLWLTSLLVIASGEFRKWQNPMLLLTENTQTHPQSYMAHYYLGRELVAQKDLTKALVHFNRALEILPNSVDLVRTVAWLEMQWGRCSNAVPLFNRLLAQGIYRDVSVPLATCYSRSANLPGALEVLRQHLSHYPDDLKAQQLLESLQDR